VDVVSPNNAELGGFFDKATMSADNTHVDYRAVERMCGSWLASGIGVDGTGGIVIRCGKDGCYVASEGKRKWLPAYHQDGGKVVDPTGGGNGFLGGLAVGLVRCGGIGALEEATLWGSVAASFAIEQVGMPVLEKGEERNGEEKWNGIIVDERLGELRKRVEGYVQP
jgi:sugar/nucleoside kinase (ribokinase family)